MGDVWQHEAPSCAARSTPTEASSTGPGPDIGDAAPARCGRPLRCLGCARGAGRTASGARAGFLIRPWRCGASSGDAEPRTAPGHESRRRPEGQRPEADYVGAGCPRAAAASGTASVRAAAVRRLHGAGAAARAAGAAARARGAGATAGARRGAGRGAGGARGLRCAAGAIAAGTRRSAAHGTASGAFAGTSYAGAAGRHSRRFRLG
mmetsp:Transcript_95312/g.308767  ORF Transcript_95312/g.308767 Transcript_95312/m.308767 type:complete len:207 (-) Transcript_95312:790-1410(-)